jgi:hypothetical protein
VRKIVVGILFVLVSATTAWSQNDFPFASPGIEPWAQSPQPTPQAGYNFQSGTAWGPNSTWAPRGSTVQFDLILDWWALGPLLLSPISDTGLNMRWIGGDQWRGWCIRCQFAFEAGDDNPQLWIDYLGSEQFGVHIENVQIIVPQVPLILEGNLKQVTKDNAASKRDTLNNLSDALSALSTAAGVAALTNPGWGIASGALGAQALAASRIARDQDGIARDPCDPNNCDYNNPAPFYRADSCAVGCYMSDDQGLGIAGTYNAAVDAELDADADLGAGIESSNRSGFCRAIGNSDCESWQYWNAIWYFNQAGQRLQDAGAGIDGVGEVLRNYFGDDVGNVLHDMAEGLYWTGVDMNDAQ